MNLAVFSEPGFLAPAECAAVRRGMDLGSAEEAEVLSDGIQVQAAVRFARFLDPDPVLIRSVEARLDGCRERVVTALGLPLREREGAGFIRYPPGGFYRAHRDRGEDPDWEGAARRAVALVLFLNTSRATGQLGEFDGGILRLFLTDGEVDVVPEAGLLVAFPADVLHEVTEVRGGTRDTVVDWFYGVS